jgi:uncharacterized membrane protein
MNHPLAKLSAALSLGAIDAFPLAVWRRLSGAFLLLALFGMGASAQTVIQTPNWSNILDNSRAINWSSAGFTIPNYTVNCVTQPSLAAGSSAAAANSSSIQNALNSCDATHNVVNLPAGTFYTNGWKTDGYNKTVVRGAGANSTYIYLRAEACGGSQAAGVCIESSDNTYDGSSTVLAGGNQQCSWTAGYSQGSTTITLNSCPAPPPVNNILVLDQANDASDTGGVYHCDGNQSGCNYEGGFNGNGRVISGAEHSQAQITYVTAISGSGTGPYTVTISPGVYFNNIRSSQSPGAWWFTNAVNDGIENLTLDGTSIGDHNMNFYNCYQCWVKGVRSINAPDDHLFLGQSAFSVVRDSYFYQGQNHGSESYAIEFEIGSGNLIENNIFQQNTNPIMFGAGTGNVLDYNFEIDNVTTSLYSLQTAYFSHNTGSSMNLWEGNNQIGLWTDDAWGSSSLGTVYRNLFHGWQGGGYSTGFIPLQVRTWIRGYNVIGNVLGHAGSQTTYQSYATSSTGGVSGGDPPAGVSIYELGWADTDGYGSCGTGGASSPHCDPLVFSTLMRWGNYDTVSAATRWNSTEASPASATYIAANFTTSYFSTLAQTLPNSLIYSSKPSWWPASKNWPAVGPDVSTGNVGTCSGGTYAGYQSTSAGKCTGGTLATAWASHVTSIPAEDCYLTTMGGPPDGTGSVLSFNASSCYTSSGTTSGTGPLTPIGLTGAAVLQ